MNKPRYPQDKDILNQLGIDFKQDRSGFWKMSQTRTVTPEKAPDSPSRLKAWIVDRLVEGQFNRDYGVSYLIALIIRRIWGKGFERA